MTEGGAGEPRNAAAACSMPSPPDAALTRKPRALLPPPAGVETHAPPTERRAAVPMVRDAVVHAAPARRGVLGGGAALADDEGSASRRLEPAPQLLPPPPPLRPAAPLLATGVAAEMPEVLIQRVAATACSAEVGWEVAGSASDAAACGKGGAAVTAGVSACCCRACLAERRSRTRDTMSSSRASTRAGSDMTEPTASATESLAMT